MTDVAPRALGRIDPGTGVPRRATLCSGAIATATVLAAFALTGEDADAYFHLVLTSSMVLLSGCNLAIFPALIRLRRTHPDVHRPFRVPGGRAGAWQACGLATGMCAVAIAMALWPGLSGRGDGARRALAPTGRLSARRSPRRSRRRPT